MERPEGPASWSRIARILIVLGALVAVGAGPSRARDSGPSPAAVRCIRGIRFSIPGDARKLDLYLPASSATSSGAAVVWIHGGKGDKGDSRERSIASFLAQSGYICASINYGDDGPFLDNILACKAAVRFLRASAKDYGIDPKRIAVGGASYGAYLALMVGFARNDPHFESDRAYPGVSDAVAAVIDFYGPTDYQTLIKTSRPLLRVPPDEYEAAYASYARAFSPVTYITSSAPAVFIAQGKDDYLVDFGQATKLDRLLSARSISHQLVLMDGVGHGFDFTGPKGHPLPRDLRPMILGFLEQSVGH